MGQDPNTIRREIETTREELGETVDALTYKADVKARVRNDVVARRRRLVDRVKEPFVGVAERAPSREDLSHTVEQGAGQVQQTGRQAVGMAKDNPIGLGIGAVALGFIVGLFAPHTRIEDEKLGEPASQLRERAMEQGQEVIERGQEVVRETVDSAKETAKQAASEQADEMRGSGQSQSNEQPNNQPAPTI
jgi:methyl-accepting chemotaxis protein